MASVAAHQPRALSPADIVADAIAAEGPGYRNLADNVRAGGVPNIWIRFALSAAGAALRVPRDD